MMPRAATTSDVFNALAEPRRRQIVELLARRGGRLAAGALVVALGLPQPAVSKHLGVLRRVGVVSASKAGRQRMYRLEPRELRRVHDWAHQFERLWSHQLVRIKERAESRASAESRTATELESRKSTELESRTATHLAPEKGSAR